MSKKFFVVTMVVCSIVMIVVANVSGPDYDFPLDKGTGKLFAAFIAMAVALWGAIDNLKRAVFIWAVFSFIMVYLFGNLALIAFLATCVIARVGVQSNEEIKKMLKIPFEP